MSTPTSRVVAALAFAAATAAALSAGCSSQQIINTDDHPPASPPATTTARPELSNTHLANAFDYVGYPSSGTRYFFTTPSGRWACAIVPHVEAGCQSASGAQSSMGIAGEPDTVPNGAGEEVAPNALVVERDADARFVALDSPEFVLDNQDAKVLPFNRTLAAAGFRCNVQESGVSCMSERTGKGFTFSDDGVVPQYTDVPADAP
jgi:hypothetical protein